MGTRDIATRWRNKLAQQALEQVSWIGWSMELGQQCHGSVASSQNVGKEGQPKVGKICEFEDSGGLGMDALSARCPPVLASEVVVGESLVCDSAIVDGFDRQRCGCHRLAKDISSFCWKSQTASWSLSLRLACVRSTSKSWASTWTGLWTAARAPSTVGCDLGAIPVGAAHGEAACVVEDAVCPQDGICVDPPLCRGTSQGKYGSCTRDLVCVGETVGNTGEVGERELALVVSVGCGNERDLTRG